MINKERFIVQVIKDYCEEKSIALREFSQDWLLVLEKNGSRRYVFGYDVGLNTSVSQQIANDKCATFEILQNAGVPAVPHHIYHHPSMAAYVGPSGNWLEIGEAFERYGQDVVLKPVSGTGGVDVARIRSVPQLEGAVQALFAKGRSLCLSPFINAQAEYRAIVLDGSVLASFKKVRPSVVGDGSSSLAQLMVQAGYAAALAERSDDVGVVPSAGSHVEVEWRHNLGLGSVPSETEPEYVDTISVMAKQAAAALGLRFASIDIVASDELQVLEVNSGVMMERFGRSSVENEATARAIYRAALSEISF